MYGLFIPILFPITLLGIFSMYMSETLLLAYWTRKPPSYDERMTQRVFELLEYPPIFMFSFGYWALGNRQIFFNMPGHFDLTADQTSFTPGHRVFGEEGIKIEWGWTPSIISLFIFGIMCLYVTVSQAIFRIMGCISSKRDAQGFKRNSSIADEKLGNYFDCLTKEDKF